MSHNPNRPILSVKCCAKGKKRDEELVENESANPFTLGWNAPFPRSPAGIVLSIPGRCNCCATARDDCKSGAGFRAHFSLTLDDSCPLVYAFVLWGRQDFIQGYGFAFLHR